MSPRKGLKRRGSWAGAFGGVVVGAGGIGFKVAWRAYGRVKGDISKWGCMEG